MAIFINEHSYPECFHIRDEWLQSCPVETSAEMEPSEPGVIAGLIDEPVLIYGDH